MDTAEEVQESLDYARERLAWHEERLAGYKEEVARLEEQVAALTPPFQVGERVQHENQWVDPETIESIGQVGGRWVVFVEGDTEPLLASVYRKAAVFPRVGARFRSRKTDRTGTILAIDGALVHAQFDGITGQAWEGLDWVRSNWEEIA